MQIDIPTTVNFKTKRKDAKSPPRWYDYDSLCFMHAVRRAVSGERVEVDLCGSDYDGYDGCSDCLRESEDPA